MIKIGDRPSKKLIELVNENFDNEKKETDHKNQVLALMIKDFRMIKFYSQMMKSKEFLQLLSLKLGLKMIKEMEKLNKQEKEMRDEGIERKIKKLTLIYSNENENLNEKERKMSQMYTKIKILTSNQENTSIEHIKSIV